MMQLLPSTLNLAIEKGYGEKDFPFPHQHLIQKWLRESHNIIVQPECNYWDEVDGWNTYSVTIFYTMENKMEDITKSFFKTYEEALEVGLVEALNLIK